MGRYLMFRFGFGHIKNAQLSLSAWWYDLAFVITYPLGRIIVFAASGG